MLIKKHPTWFCIICHEPTRFGYSCKKLKCREEYKKVNSRINYYKERFKKFAKTNIYDCIFCGHKLYQTFVNDEFPACGNSVCVSKKKKLIKDLRRIRYELYYSKNKIRICNICGQNFYFPVKRKHCGNEKCIETFKLKLHIKTNELPKSMQFFDKVEKNKPLIRLNQPLIKNKKYPCKNCGKMSVNRFLCHDCLSRKSKSLGIGGNIDTSCYYDANDMMNFISKNCKEYSELDRKFNR